MRIVSSRVIRVGGETTSRVGTASSPLARREGLLLVLTSDEGIVGVGEASPLPGYSRESLEDVERALAAVTSFPFLDREQGELTTLLPSATSSVLHAVPSARFAVETALLDVIGQSRRVPVHLLFGDAVGRPIRRSALLPAPCEASMLTAALAAVARGIRTLKLKLGARPFEDELAALGRLRVAVGEGIEIRLDANGSFGSEALERLYALAVVRPAFVEEPVSGQALVALLDELGRTPSPGERTSGSIPVAADESLADPDVGAALLTHPALGAVVVKPAMHGFLRAREIAVGAAQRGLPVVITHLFDGPVALAACAELALSLPFSPAACGLDVHPALAAYPARRIPQLDDPARIAPVKGSGLCTTPGPRVEARP